MGKEIHRWSLKSSHPTCQASAPAAELCTGHIIFRYVEISSCAEPFSAILRAIRKVFPKLIFRLDLGLKLAFHAHSDMLLDAGTSLKSFKNSLYLVFLLQLFDTKAE